MFTKIISFFATWAAWCAMVLGIMWIILGNSSGWGRDAYGFSMFMTLCVGPILSGLVTIFPDER